MENMRLNPIDISNVENVKSVVTSDNGAIVDALYSDIQNIITEVCSVKRNAVIICYSPSIAFGSPYMTITQNIKVVFIPGDQITMRNVVDTMVKKLSDAGFGVTDVPAAEAMIITWC